MVAKSSTYRTLLLLFSKAGSQGRCPRLAALFSHACLCLSGRKHPSWHRSSQTSVAPTRDEDHSLHHKRSGKRAFSFTFFFSVGALRIESKSGSWGARKGIRDGGTTWQCCVCWLYFPNRAFAYLYLEQMIWTELVLPFVPLYSSLLTFIHRDFFFKVFYIVKSFSFLYITRPSPYTGNDIYSVIIFIVSFKILGFFFLKYWWPDRARS